MSHFSKQIPPPYSIGAEDEITMKKTKKLANKAGAAGREKHQIFFLNLGKLILDLAKMSFASLVLGIILKGEIPQETLLNAGIIVTGAGSIFGLIVIALFEEK
jgi:hypothetical protein